MEYHRLADQTLDKLTEYLEELQDTGICHPDYDVHMAISCAARGVRRASTCDCGVQHDLLMCIMP